MVAVILGLCMGASPALAQEPNTQTVTVRVWHDVSLSRCIRDDWNGVRYSAYPFLGDPGNLPGLPHPFTLTPTDFGIGGMWLVSDVYTHALGIPDTNGDWGQKVSLSLRFYQASWERTLMYVSLNGRLKRLEEIDCPTVWPAYGDVPFEVMRPVAPAPEPPPERTPKKAEETTPEPEPTRIEVVLRNSTVGGLLPSVKSDQDIPFGRLKLWVNGHRWSIGTGDSIEASEETRLVGRSNARMGDVKSVHVKTLYGRSVSEWECSAEDDPFDAELRFTCIIASTFTLPSLTDVEDADMWVLVFGRRVSDSDRLWGRNRKSTLFYIRAGDRDLGRTHFYYPSDAWVSGYSSRSCDDRLEAGATCNAGGWPGPTYDPASIEIVTANSSRLGLLRCELNAASNAERAVWACATW